jgi:hypothetical protein
MKPKYSGPINPRNWLNLEDARFSEAAPYIPEKKIDKIFADFKKTLGHQVKAKK